ncbi:uncharacterized protein LOC142621951 isoform X2 [Castanea sativa]|uniref:uncharacterized protein LOC142621951 isoform X2 n=1 Tax=Castanea sativa TaxID=21020 RepID=UPI003F64F6E8
MGRIAFNAVTHYKPLPPTNEKQLRDTFQKYDSNGDGLLSKAELENAFKSLGSHMPNRKAHLALNRADANADKWCSLEELDEVLKYAAEYGYVLGNDQLSKAKLENAHTCPTGEPAVSSAMLMPVYPAPPQKKEKASDPAVLCPGGTAMTNIMETVSSPKLMPIMPMETDPISTLTDKRNIYEEEKNERVKYAARYGFTTSFGFLTTEQLMEKFKQCDVNNVRQLTRAELKKRFQYLNKEELNKLVKHAPKLGFTVEP